MQPMYVGFWFCFLTTIKSFNEYAYAVKRRERLVNTDLLNRADRLDQEFNNTPVGAVGPLGAAFRRYGDGRQY